MKFKMIRSIMLFAACIALVTSVAYAGQDKGPSRGGNTNSTPPRSAGPARPSAPERPAPSGHIGVKQPPSVVHNDQKGKPHQVINHPKEDPQHPGKVLPPIHSDPRTPHVVMGPQHHWSDIHRDGRWDHWRRPVGGWFIVWNRDPSFEWINVSQVSCEAVNETTGQLFPVTAVRADWQWNDQTVDDLLEEALDDCYAAGGNDTICQPTGEECTPVYVSSGT